MKQIGSILAGVLAVLLIAGVASAVVSLDTDSPSTPLAIGSEDEADDGRATSTSMATSTTMGERTETSVPSTTAPASTSPQQPTIETIDAGEAGTVTVGVANGSVTVVAVTPSAGWAYQVEQRERSEAEIRFEASDARVEVNAEFDDGRLKVEVEQSEGTMEGPTSGDCVKDDDDLGDHDSSDCVDDDHGTYDDSVNSDDHGTYDDSVNSDDHGTYDDDSVSSDDQGSYDDDDHRSDNDGRSDDDDDNGGSDDDDHDDDHSEDDGGSRDH